MTKRSARRDWQEFKAALLLLGTETMWVSRAHGKITVFVDPTELDHVNEVMKAFNFPTQEDAGPTISLYTFEIDPERFCNLD